MKIDDINNSVRTLMITGETYYNLGDLLSQFSAGLPLCVTECIIVPYYISDGQRYELYQFELVVKKNKDFKHYIEEETGRDYEKIPTSVKSIRKKCYIELESDNSAQVNNLFLEYIRFLLNDSLISNAVNNAMAEWNPNNMYCLIY